MNVKRIFLLGTAVLLLSQCQVNAYTEKDITEYTNGIVRVVEGSFSEEDLILDDFAKDIEINGKLYTTESVERTETEDNIKAVTKQKMETLNTSNETQIRKHFGEKYQYKDEEYKGELSISNIDIKTISQGSYEEIDEQKIKFNGYSQNDLNEISKEIQLNNTTYYLINVDWKVEKSEIVDSQEVPVTYEGTMIYQTVLTKRNPNKYDVTVTYSGDVEKIDTNYKYSILYQPVQVEEEIVVEEKEESPVIPILISGLGVGVLACIIMLFGGSVKIYNKTDNGHKLIGKFKVDEQNNVIDITKYQYKTSTNFYSVKLNRNTYSKLKDKPIYIKVGKIKKPIYVNAPYMEVII